MSNENGKNLSVPSTPGAMPSRATHLEGPRGFPWREPKQMSMLRHIYPCESVSIRGPFFSANIRE